MNNPFGNSLLSIVLLTTLPSSSQAQPQTFPEFPDSPNPGGEGGGGDKVPYIPHKDWLLQVPVLDDVRMLNRRLYFRFRASGPVMRWNIVWSRPGKQDEHTLWFDGKTPKNNAEYSIDEPIIWDTDYSIKVQAESWRFEGQERYQITPFVEKTFRTPPNPAISDRIDANESRNFIDSRRTTTTFEPKGGAVRLSGKPTTTTLVSRSAAYGVISAGQATNPSPPPIVVVPDPGLPLVFSPPLLEDNAQLWACADAAASEISAGACSGIESALAYCQLRDTQSGPDPLVAVARLGIPVRAVNGDICQDGDACRVVSQLQCDR